ncbi:hypothetical protein AA103587_1132 [Gluconobacter kanchanaburiensis NBRC 103587]|nr:hypothetical protein AA103587_1132 [Gluconobacter kanchanaburiensis NBRC 103587]
MDPGDIIADVENLPDQRIGFAKQCCNLGGGWAVVKLCGIRTLKKRASLENGNFPSRPQSIFPSRNGLDYAEVQGTRYRSQQNRDTARSLGVELMQRIVKQQHVRGRDEGAGKTRSKQLFGGELCRTKAGDPVKAQKSNHPSRSRVCLGSIHEGGPEAECDIVP